MEPNLTQSVTHAVALFAVMLLVIATGVYVARMFRGRSDDNQPGALAELSNFQEMHGRGDLSDEEFRTIKTQLASKVQAQLRDSEQTG